MATLTRASSIWVWAAEKLCTSGIQMPVPFAVGGCYAYRPKMVDWSLSLNPVHLVGKRTLEKAWMTSFKRASSAGPIPSFLKRGQQFCDEGGPNKLVRTFYKG